MTTPEPTATATAPLHGEKILVTGATGQVALPVALALAPDNEVWASARFTDATTRARLEAAGVNCARVDLVRGDLSALPQGFTVVLNFAVVKSGRWDVDLDGNVGALGFLMEHCRDARAFLHCSSTGVYEPRAHHVFREDDPLGDNHRAYASELPFMETYSITKIAAEAMARYGARRWNLPTTIARLNVPYGDNGGWPAFHLEMILRGLPIAVHPDGPVRFNPIHEDDIVASIPGLLHAATVPATVVNWGGEPASIEEWCAYLGGLVGVDAAFITSNTALGSVPVDLERLHELTLAASVPWHEGFRRMVEARHPEVLGPRS
jgi:UDP-glucuronate 4-epimerase